MDYSSVRIEILNIPHLKSLGNKQCCKRYFYRFVNVLPNQSTIPVKVEKVFGMIEFMQGDPRKMWIKNRDYRLK